jgi:very-short-patch-repair endonuclease
VELDGASHNSEDQDAEDEWRQAWLESQGYRVLRFSGDYPDHLEGVWDTIRVALEEVRPSVALRATSPRSGEDV